MKREVTERDFRKPEFVNAVPEDYEFRDDGAIVRKDRWETGIRSIASILVDSRTEFEIPDIVERVRLLASKYLDWQEIFHYGSFSQLMDDYNDADVFDLMLYDGSILYGAKITSMKFGWNEFEIDPWAPTSRFIVTHFRVN